MLLIEGAAVSVGRKHMPLGKQAERKSRLLYLDIVCPPHVWKRFARLFESITHSLLGQ